jgi:prepilin-type N-terminal cleavage/methylation domain-containing protein
MNHRPHHPLSLADRALSRAGSAADVRLRSRVAFRAQPSSLQRRSPRSRSGFTLIEVLIATALLGFSLIVMFGFHSQAVRSNRDARRMTACTYLAQSQMEQLLTLPWTVSTRHADLTDGMADTTSSSTPWAYLEHPNSAAQPSALNAANESTSALGKPIYYVTWDVEDMDTDGTWTRVRVRCQYEDSAFNSWRGTTVASYRFRD